KPVPLPSTMPCLWPSPDRGSTTAQRPGSPRCIARPDGTSAVSPGSSTRASSSAARRSRPALAAVAYSGSGHSVPKRWSRILISSVWCMRFPAGWAGGGRSARGQALGDDVEQRGGEIGLAGRPELDPQAVAEHEQRIVVALEPAALHADAVGADQVQALALQLGARIGFDVAGLGGETDNQRRARRAGRHVGKDVGGAHQLQHQAVLAGTLLDLFRGDGRRGEVGDRGGADVGVGRQRGHYRGMHLRRRAHVDALDPLRRRQRDRAGDQRRAGAAGGGRGRDREPHLAAAAVAEEPDRVEVLEGRAGADHDPAPGKPVGVQADARASAATIASGSIIRPSPTSPHACPPESGPSSSAPRARRVSTLAWVAGWAHISRFIAGASASGASVARHRVLTRSSASPWARRALVLALAGAMTMRSGQRASSIWPIAASAAASHSEVRTGRPDSAWKVVAVTNRSALAVMATCTTAPASASRRTSAAAL